MEQFQTRQHNLEIDAAMVHRLRVMALHGELPQHDGESKPPVTAEIRNVRRTWRGIAVIGPQAILRFSVGELEAWLDGAKKGEFDHLT